MWTHSLLLQLFEEVYIPHSAAITSIVVTFYMILYYATKPTKQQTMRKELISCYKELCAMIKASNCNPIMLRLGWSDAVTYDQTIKKWPNCGGVNGSIRFDAELNLPANAGLAKAISLLVPLKKRFKFVSWADLIQMAAVVSVHAAGGPRIDLDYGRLDAPEEDEEESQFRRNGCAPSRPILPCPFAPYPDGAPSADVHIRNVFYRMGLNNRETVALCGAHTLGRAFKDRSGVCSFSSGDQGATVYTKSNWDAKGSGDVSGGVGMAGGCSWTKTWLRFDNTYFQRVGSTHGDMSSYSNSVPSDDSPMDRPDDNSQLLWLPTDQALYDCPEYRAYFLLYGADQDAFFRDFAAAYRKVSELGARFGPVVRLHDTQ